MGDERSEFVVLGMGSAGRDGGSEVRSVRVGREGWRGEDGGEVVGWDGSRGGRSGGGSRTGRGCSKRDGGLAKGS